MPKVKLLKVMAWECPRCAYMNVVLDCSELQLKVKCEDCRRTFEVEEDA